MLSTEPDHTAHEIVGGSISKIPTWVVARRGFGGSHGTLLVQVLTDRPAMELRANRCRTTDGGSIGWTQPEAKVPGGKRVTARAGGILTAACDHVGDTYDRARARVATTITSSVAAAEDLARQAKSRSA